MTSSSESKFNLERTLNGLQSSEKSVKKIALQELKNKIDQMGPNELEELYDKIWKVLLSCFQDRLEMCREGSLAMTKQLMNSLEPRESYIAHLIPAIRRRFGNEKVVEESEEVRLLLVQLLEVIIIKYEESLAPYTEDVIEILASAVGDSAPLVKRQCCICISQVAKTLKYEFFKFSKNLIQPLTDSILHQHWRVRVAIIEAIGSTVLYGDNKAVADLVGPLARRFFDDNYNVRLATTKVVGMWLMELPDRYSFFPHLIPLILTSLTDDCEEVATEGHRLWDAAGKQYLSENESDYKERIDFLPEKLENYPHGVKRPNLGCRGLVEREACKFLLTVGRELTDWVLSIRIKSALLLGQLILHAEDKVTQQLEKILPSIYKATMDPEPPVAEYTLKAAEYLGYFVPTDVLVRLVVEQAALGSPGELRSLAAMIRGMRGDNLAPHLDSISPALFHPSFKEEDQVSQLILVKSLMEICDEKCYEIGETIWATIISNFGMAANEEVADQCVVLLDRFVKLGSGDKVEVHKKYSGFLVGYISQKLVWTSHCHEQFMFSAIIDIAGEAIECHIDEILGLLRSALGSESDPESSLTVVMATSRLLGNKETALPDASLLNFSETLIKEILSPILTWKAGRSAEALRTAGAALLLSALRTHYRARVREEVGSDGVRGDAALGLTTTPTLLSLVEDSAPTTRALAIRSVSLTAPDLVSPSDNFAKVVQVILKRFDDSDKEVRELSINCVKILFEEYFQRTMPNSINNGLLEFVYNTLLIHLDDQDSSFQSTVLDCLKSIGSINKPLLRSRIFKENFRNKEICEKLLTHFEQL